MCEQLYLNFDILSHSFALKSCHITLGKEGHQKCLWGLFAVATQIVKSVTDIHPSMTDSKTDTFSSYHSISRSSKNTLIPRIAEKIPSVAEWVKKLSIARNRCQRLQEQRSPQRMETELLQNLSYLHPVFVSFSYHCCGQMTRSCMYICFKQWYQQLPPCFIIPGLPSNL